MLATTPTVRCRVRIVNDLRERTTIVESSRERIEVWFDLARLVRLVNKPGNSLRSCLSLQEDTTLVLHFHCPKFSMGMIAREDGLRNVDAAIAKVEQFIGGGGPHE